MTDLLVLDLVAKGLVTDQIVLDIGYDVSNLQRADLRAQYKGPLHIDHYGRTVPKPAHGSINLRWVYIIQQNHPAGCRGAL